MINNFALFLKTLVKRLFYKRNKDIFFKKSYSQDGEDVVLFSFFENDPLYHGSYIDIGAHHPFRYSNTQLFYDLGWRGLNIDSTPGSMDKFKIYRAEDTNLEIGISAENKDLPFYSFQETAYNSFDEKLSEERIKKGCKLLNKIILPTYSINSILQKYWPVDRKIDFLNIDVEGFDFEIIKSLDLKKYIPGFILIEDLSLKGKDILDFRETEIYLYLKENGYVFIAKTFRTLIFKKI